MSSGFKTLDEAMTWLEARPPESLLIYHDDEKDEFVLIRAGYEYHYSKVTHFTLHARVTLRREVELEPCAINCKD